MAAAARAAALACSAQHARKPAALTAQATTLGNARQTLVVLGFVKHPASAFERLSFAGKLMRELAAAPAGSHRAYRQPHHCPDARALVRGTADRGLDRELRTAAFPQPRLPRAGACKSIEL